LELNPTKSSAISDDPDSYWEYTQTKRADRSNVDSDEWTDSKTEFDRVIEKTTNQQSGVVTRQPIG